VIRRISIQQRQAGWVKSLIASVSLLFLGVQAQSQEALRMSLAGDMAAESQRQAASTIGYYNLLWGPVAWRFSSGLGLDFDDNVNLQSKNQESDFILRPNLNAQMHWPVTQRNSLDISLGAGYSLYTTHSELNQFYVNPGSGLSFDIYAGDCVINVHDRVTITENSYQNPTAGNNGNYSQLENAAGTSLLWDLNKVVAQFGYDHLNNVSLGTSEQIPDSTSDNWFLNAGVRVLPEVTAGVEGGVGLIRYDQGQSTAPQPDATQWNAGVFCKAQISEYISGRIDAGYTKYLPGSTTGFTNLSSSANLYFQASISHELNKFINYSLTAGRSTDSSYFGQPYDYYFVRMQPSWNLFRNYQLSTPFFWEQGTQLYTQASAVAENYTQYGAGINISRAITKKLTGTLSYQFVEETSDQSDLNYTVNIVSLSFSYQF
jgi:hypothetical protein